jgi:hypothetical protein
MAPHPPPPRRFHPTVVVDGVPGVERNAAAIVSGVLNGTIGAEVAAPPWIGDIRAEPGERPRVHRLGAFVPVAHRPGEAAAVRSRAGSPVGGGVRVLRLALGRRASSGGVLLHDRGDFHERLAGHVHRIQRGLHVLRGRRDHGSISAPQSPATASSGQPKGALPVSTVSRVSPVPEESGSVAVSPESAAPVSAQVSPPGDSPFGTSSARPPPITDASTSAPEGSGAWR